MAHSMGLHAQANAPSFFSSSPSSPADTRRAAPAPATTPGPSRSSVPDSPFEGFSVPSIPPRLRDIGRQLSASAREFLDDPIVPAPDTRASGFGGQVRRRTSAGTPVSASVSTPDGFGKSPMGTEVPGMGDEPVLCPFCDKPLPPALFERHSHAPKPKPKVAPPPGLARSQTINGALPPSRFAALAHSEIAKAEAPSLSRSATPRPDEQPVSKADADPAVNSETLGPVLARADSTNHRAAELDITAQDLQRWSRVAGIALPALPEDKPTPLASVDVKPFPLLAPPPPPAATVAKAGSSRPSSRFGFFGRQAKVDEEDDSDDEGAGASGYAKLDTGADVEDDDDEPEAGKVHDEPEEMEHVKESRTDVEQPGEASKTEAVVSPTQAPAPPADGELRAVLKEVLDKVNGLTTSHAALLDSQSVLLTSLKIARSNLAMAEANSEMLEEQLKRATAAASVRGGRPAAPTSAFQAGRVASGPAGSAPGTSAPAPAPVNPAMSRLSGEQTRSVSAAPTSRVSASADEPRSRPTSLQMPAPNLANQGPSTGPASHAHTQSQSQSQNSWNFPFRTKRADGTSRIPSAAQIMNMPLQLPSSRPQTPTKERERFDFASLLPNTPAAAYSAAVDFPRPTPTTPASLPRSASSVNLTSPAPQAQSAAELTRLKAHLQAAQAQITGMSKELTELKKGKLDMEAELENLSQALFEEANKMVADERRKRAEVEDSLKEVRAEKDALRQTVKVLGGSAGAGEGEGEDGEEEGEGEEERSGGERKTSAGSDESFRPRDLDKHYEALKRAVHHVGGPGLADSAGAAGGAAASTSPEDHPIMPGGVVDLGDEVDAFARPVPSLGAGAGAGAVGMSKSRSDTGVGAPFGRLSALSPVPERVAPPLSLSTRVEAPHLGGGAAAVPPDIENPWAAPGADGADAVGVKEVDNGALGKMQEMDGLMEELRGEMRLDKEEDAELKGQRD